MGDINPLYGALAVIGFLVLIKILARRPWLTITEACDYASQGLEMHSHLWLDSFTEKFHLVNNELSVFYERKATIEGFSEILDFRSVRHSNGYTVYYMNGGMRRIKNITSRFFPKFDPLDNQNAEKLLKIIQDQYPVT